MKFMRHVLLCLISLISTQVVFAQNLPVVKFIATGGTIAMKIDPVKNAPVPAINGDDLLAAAPEVGKYAKIEVNNISNVPSDYMNPDRCGSCLASRS